VANSPSSTIFWACATSSTPPDHHSVRGRVKRGYSSLGVCKAAKVSS